MAQHVIIDGTAHPYERLEARLDSGRFRVGPEVRKACSECPTFGHNFACPPHSPWFADYVGGRGPARVLCLRMATAGVDRPTAGECARACFRALGSVLREELLDLRRRGAVVVGSGECLACPTCAAAAGGPVCLQPEERIFSLEALGVDVTALVRECFSLDLQWNREGAQAGVISAVGAAFGLLR